MVTLIDIGTLDKIRDGSIKIRGGIDRLTPDGVVFADATTEEFGAIILATGFRPDLRQLVPDVDGVFDSRGMPLVTGQATGAWPDYVPDRTVAGDRTGSAPNCGSFQTLHRCAQSLI